MAPVSAVQKIAGSPILKLKELAAGVRSGTISVLSQSALNRRERLEDLRESFSERNAAFGGLKSLLENLRLSQNALDPVRVSQGAKKTVSSNGDLVSASSTSATPKEDFLVKVFQTATQSVVTGGVLPASISTIGSAISIRDINHETIRVSGDSGLKTGDAITFSGDVPERLNSGGPFFVRQKGNDRRVFEVFRTAAEALSDRDGGRIEFRQSEIRNFQSGSASLVRVPVETTFSTVQGQSVGIRDVERRSITFESRTDLRTGDAIKFSGNVPKELNTNETFFVRESGREFQIYRTREGALQGGSEGRIEFDRETAGFNQIITTATAGRRIGPEISINDLTRNFLRIDPRSGLRTGDAVRFQGDVPGELNTTDPFFVRRTDDGEIELFQTRAQALSEGRTGRVEFSRSENRSFVAGSASLAEVDVEITRTLGPDLTTRGIERNRIVLDRGTGLETGDAIRFSSDPPRGLNSGETYFVRNAGGNEFKLYRTAEQALDGGSRGLVEFDDRFEPGSASAAQQITVSQSRIAPIRVNLDLNTRIADSNIPGLDLSNGRGSFTINGKQFDFTGRNTIGELLASINNDPDAGVTASINSTTRQFTLTRTANGPTEITLNDVTGNFLSSNRLLATSGATQAVGTNAIFSINDGEKITSSTNSIAPDVTGIAGLSLELRGVTTTIATEEEVTFDTAFRVQRLFRNGFITGARNVFETGDEVKVNGRVAPGFDTDQTFFVRRVGSRAFQLYETEEQARRGGSEGRIEFSRGDIQAFNRFGTATVSEKIVTTKDAEVGSGVTISVFTDPAKAVAAVKNLFGDAKAVQDFIAANTAEGGALEGDAQVKGIGQNLRRALSPFFGFGSLGDTLSAGTASNNIELDLDSLEASIESDFEGILNLLRNVGGGGGITSRVRKAIGDQLGSTGGIARRIASSEREQAIVNEQLSASLKEEEDTRAELARRLAGLTKTVAASLANKAFIENLGDKSTLTRTQNQTTGTNPLSGLLAQITEKKERLEERTSKESASDSQPESFNTLLQDLLREVTQIGDGGGTLNFEGF